MNPKLNWKVSGLFQILVGYRKEKTDHHTQRKMARKTQCETSLPSNFSAIFNWNSFAIKSFISWIFISCTELDVSFSPMVVNKQQNEEWRRPIQNRHVLTCKIHGRNEQRWDQTRDLHRHSATWLVDKKKSWGVIGAGYLRAGNSAFWIDVSFEGLFEIMVKDRHRQDIFAWEIRRYWSLFFTCREPAAQYYGN